MGSKMERGRYNFATSKKHIYMKGSSDIKILCSPFIMWRTEYISYSDICEVWKPGVNSDITCIYVAWSLGEGPHF